MKHSARIGRPSMPTTSSQPWENGGLYGTRTRYNFVTGNYDTHSTIDQMEYPIRFQRNYLAQHPYY